MRLVFIVWACLFLGSCTYFCNCLGDGANSVIERKTGVILEYDGPSPFPDFDKESSVTLKAPESPPKPKFPPKP